MKRVAACIAVLLAACGGGGGADSEGGGGPRALAVRVRNDPPGVVVATGTSCRFDGDRQFTAQGVVRNAGDDTHHVSISVRFIDADGVRVDLASDSVSDLERGESAHWDASIYNDDGAAVRTCEVSTKAS
jgi:hypothetical protein